MIEDKYKRDKKRNEYLYYYCDNIKECIDRNSFIKETRKKLKKKKLIDVYNLIEKI
ncbi:MAG: hypothetical protein ACFFBH_05605 [Promethearchaeota archaeon]